MNTSTRRLRDTNNRTSLDSRGREIESTNPLFSECSPFLSVECITREYNLVAQLSKETSLVVEGRGSGFSDRLPLGLEFGKYLQRESRLSITDYRVIDFGPESFRFDHLPVASILQDDAVRGVRSGFFRHAMPLASPRITSRSRRGLRRAHNGRRYGERVGLSHFERS